MDDGIIRNFYHGNNAFLTSRIFDTIEWTHNWLSCHIPI
jgi:hypothetical protein